MTRSVRIQESGVSQDFSDVKTVTTPVVGGGNATWMPEDETAVGEITITGNGEFVPSEHNLYGFYKVNVIVPGGGQGEYVSPSGIGVNIDGTIPMTKPDGTISNVRIGDGPYIPPPAGMGGTIDGVSVSGGTIAGIDPNTGEYVQYTVVDSDGVPTLSMTTPQSEPRPASIRIINPPSQTTYAPGELIKYSGLQVGVYDQNGNQFTAPAFTVDGHTYGPYDGTIPFNELNFPVKYASDVQGTTYKSSDGKVTAKLFTYGGTLLKDPGTSMWCAFSNEDAIKYEKQRTMKFASKIGYSESGYVSGNRILATVYNGAIYVQALQDTFNPIVGYSDMAINPNDPTKLAEEPKNHTTGNNAPYGRFNRLSFSEGHDFLDIPTSTADPSSYDAANMESENSQVPVEWLSPYDNITYGDHFSISVTGSSNGGYSGSGGGSFDGSNDGYSGSGGGSF